MPRPQTVVPLKMAVRPPVWPSARPPVPHRRPGGRALHSGIFHGTVRHRRSAPVEHAFGYRICMLYLDLAELDEVFSGSRLFSARRRAVAEFRRADHLGDPAVPLAQAVRDLVEQQTGRRPDGPIRLLTHLRYFGHVFNPVSFYYCYDRADQRVTTIVAEVNNTPWGEQHCYVLGEAADHGSGGIPHFRPVKRLHVSPFMPMDVAYDWRFRPPGAALTVHMGIARRGEPLFDATLLLHRREITPAALARVLLAFPLMTVQVVVGIHWQALKLWLKRCPVYDHAPQDRSASAAVAVKQPEIAAGPAADPAFGPAADPGTAPAPAVAEAVDAAFSGAEIKRSRRQSAGERG